MTHAGWRLIEAMARCLVPAERDAVLGDLAEAEGSVWAAARDVLGLIARRQAGLWKAWRPWLALVGVSVLAGEPVRALALRLQVDAGQQLSTYAKYGVWYGTGLTPAQQAMVLLCLAAALTGWSWTCGFAMGSLAGRAAWITCLVFGVVVMSGPGIAGLLLLPAWIGARSGVRRRVLSVRAACVVAAAILTLTVLTLWSSGWYAHAHEIWSGGLWRGGTRPLPAGPLATAGWPALWLLASALHATRERTQTI